VTASQVEKIAPAVFPAATAQSTVIWYERLPLPCCLLQRIAPLLSSCCCIFFLLLWQVSLVAFLPSNSIFFTAAAHTGLALLQRLYAASITAPQAA